jgi:hypothetical protein
MPGPVHAEQLCTTAPAGSVAVASVSLMGGRPARHPHRPQVKASAFAYRTQAFLAYSS